MKRACSNCQQIPPNSHYQNVGFPTCKHHLTITATCRNSVIMELYPFQFQFQYSADASSDCPRMCTWNGRKHLPPITRLLDFLFVFTSSIIRPSRLHNSAIMELHPFQFPISVPSSTTQHQIVHECADGMTEKMFTRLRLSWSMCQRVTLRYFYSCRF